MYIYILYIICLCWWTHVLRRKKTTQDNSILDMDPAPSAFFVFAPDFVEAALASLPWACLPLWLAAPGQTSCRFLEALLVAPSLPEITYTRNANRTHIHKTCIHTYIHAWIQSHRHIHKTCIQTNTTQTHIRHTQDIHKTYTLLRHPMRTVS